MSLKAALADVARFRAGMAAERTRWQHAVVAGVSQETDALKNAVRAVAAQAFPGSRRVVNAVRGRVYDNGERGAAGIVYSRFGKRAAGAFADFIAPRLFGATVLPRLGKWLAIPVHWGRVRPRSKRRRAAELAAEGRLVFVPIRGGRNALLVERKRFKTGRGDRDVPVYLLVPRVRYPRRTDARALLAQSARRLPGSISRAYAGALGGAAVRAATGIALA